MVPKVLRDVRLHLARTPPCSILDVLHYGRHWGLSRWRPFSLLHVIARPATKAPGHRTVTYGVVAARRLPLEEPHNTARTAASAALYDTFVPAWHFTDCQDGVANGAGPSECTAGVTPAPSENLGQDD